jgi:AcrR family transcriptional regulator
VNSRLPQLLDRAATVFAEHGFTGASIREIVGPIGMLPGSLYSHFPTKERLLVAVYREGVERISKVVDKAIEKERDPWARLEAACVAHLSSVLDKTNYSQVVIRVRPSDAPSAAEELIALRNDYESRFMMLVDALELPRNVDRRDFRLLLVGALNWSQTWYRPSGSRKPAEIARRFVRILKIGIADQ